MKKGILIFSLIVVLLFAVFQIVLSSSHIKNVSPKKCVIETEKIIKISEGTSNDIVFSNNHGGHYYINRGLERGLNLDSLNAKVLNKTVTLHLPKVLGGLVTSGHIAQLAVGNTIIFTEFDK
jgi:hypothetical protein